MKPIAQTLVPAVEDVKIVWYVNIICIYPLVNLFFPSKREKHNVPNETFYMSFYYYRSVQTLNILSTMESSGGGAGGERPGAPFTWGRRDTLEALTPRTRRRSL